MSDREYPGTAARFGWVMFDWAAQPVFLLILTFFYGPYFVSQFAADPVAGQVTWGLAISVSGLIVALAGPPLGAIADNAGYRKRWIAVFSVMLVVGSALLWLAGPDARHLMPLIVAAVILTFVGAEFATVFTNAMLPALAPPQRIGRLSGIGWSTGYAGALVALAVFLLGIFPAHPDGTTLAGIKPLIRLDAATHEPDRFTGPFSAVWYVLFVIPLFLLTPDVRTRARKPIAAAARDGMRELAQTITSVRRNATLFRFLVARMLYADGLNAIFTFGGIYATSIFGWSGLNLAYFALTLSVTGLIGAIVGGVVDDRIGPRPVIVTCLIGLLLSAGFALSIDDRYIAFAIESVPAPDPANPFSSPAEYAFIVAAALMGLVIGPLQASSRSLMSRLTPLDKSQEYFGLFAFSGKATSFAAPAIVTAVTVATGSQRIGMTMIAAFLVAGLLMMLTLRLPEFEHEP